MWTCIERLCQKNTDVQIPSFLQHNPSVVCYFEIVPDAYLSVLLAGEPHRFQANTPKLRQSDGQGCHLAGRRFDDESASCQLITEHLATFAVSFSDLPRMRQNDPTGAGGASSLPETGRPGRTCLEECPSPSF